MRVVLDTNILISGLLFGGPPLEILSLAEASAIEVVTADAALGELLDVLGRPKLSGRLDALGVTPSQAVFRYRRIAILVEPGQLPKICSDDSDNLFIAIAVAGSAEIIVSGDSHLLDCSDVSPVPVVTPSQFLDICRRSLKDSRS